MKIPTMTPGERRSILSVAAAALLCIGAGVAVRQCHTARINAVAEPPAPTLLTAPDSTASEKSRSREKTGSREKTDKKKKSSKKSRPHRGPVPPRSPLDDTIPTR